MSIADYLPKIDTPKARWKLYSALSIILGGVLTGCAEDKSSQNDPMGTLRFQSAHMTDELTGGPPAGGSQETILKPVEERPIDLEPETEFQRQRREEFEAVQDKYPVNRDADPILASFKAHNGESYGVYWTMNTSQATHNYSLAEFFDLLDQYAFGDDASKDEIVISVVNNSTGKQEVFSLEDVNCGFEIFPLDSIYVSLGTKQSLIGLHKSMGREVNEGGFSLEDYYNPQSKKFDANKVVVNGVEPIVAANEFESEEDAAWSRPPLKS